MQIAILLDRPAPAAQGDEAPSAAVAFLKHLVDYYQTATSVCVCTLIIILNWF